LHYGKNTHKTTRMKTTKFPCADSKCEDNWQGDSREIEHGSVSDYSEVSETTTSSS